MHTGENKSRICLETGRDGGYLGRGMEALLGVMVMFYMMLGVWGT